MKVMWIIFIIAVSAILITFIYAAKSAIGWVPIWSKDVASVIELAEIKQGEKFYDLGCGEGRVVVAAGRAGANAVGYEISVLFYAIAKIRAWLEKGQIEIRWGDFWRADLSKADIIFFFLIPKIFPRMIAKLEKELKPGARVISYVWPLEGWEAKKIAKRDTGPAIYLYKI